MTNGVRPRREVRSLIFHLLYASDSFGYDVSVQALIHQFNEGFEADIEPQGEIATTVTSIVAKREELDEFLVPLLANWRLERIGCCTHLILYMALWELFETDTPSTIVINEAIELAKAFSEKDAYKFINGVLDQAVKKLGKEDNK
jgi:transcription antitermination protein NusB